MRFTEWIPLPVIVITRGEVAVLFTSVRLPEKLPTERGVKSTVKVEEPLGGTERGNVSPERLKPVPAREAWVMLRLAVPVFLSVSI